MRKITLAIVGSLVLATGCTVHQSAAPAMTGPSEAALSLRMTATPDRILQDGLQNSTIAISAFDAGGAPIAVDVRLSGSPSGFGTLSSSIVKTTTDATKPVTVTYRPPVATVGNNTTVTISGVMVTSDAVNGSTQQVVISAIPAQNVLSTSPAPAFTLSPISPAQAFAVGRPISYDASGSCAVQKVAGVCPSTNSITSYTWNFGDGSIAVNGVSTTHSYLSAGTYTVTLTVQNDLGVVGSTTQSVILATVSNPTASVVASPSTVTANGIAVNFNAVGSSAASGHGIVQYDWNFGDGNSATTTSPTVAHVYTAKASYTATLTVTDDVGQKATATASITVN